MRFHFSHFAAALCVLPVAAPVAAQAIYPLHRAEIMAEFQKVQADLHKVQADLHKAINDLTIKMFGSMLASTGIIVAVVIKLAA